MTVQNWILQAHHVGPQLAEYSRHHDENGTFVQEGYEVMRDEGYFAALVPRDLGGKGANVEELCHFIRIIAQYCPSTALAYSMHSHLVATTVWKHRKGQPGEKLLRKVASDNTILVSTGAGDWLDSNGEMQKVQGGYLFSAKKPFASGSPMGALLITSGRYHDPVRGPRVLHFPLPLSTEGVQKGTDWDAHGMRGTGSHTVSIEGAFVPDDAIALDRPQGEWHPAFDVISTLALPILMSPYAGIAERSVDLALGLARRRAHDPDIQSLSGELSSLLTQTTVLWEAHVQNAMNYEFEPSPDRTSRSIQLKTQLARSCLATVEKSMEVGGGDAFFRKNGIEACLRDVRGASYHALPPRPAARHLGQWVLGLESAAFPSET